MLRRRFRFAGVVLITIFSAGACLLCAATDADPFYESHQIYNEDTLGLEAGTAAPMLSELGVIGERTILTLYAGCGSAEIVALRLVADALNVKVVAALSGCSAARIQEVQSLAGENVQLLGDPLADQLLESYRVGYRVGGNGITFLIDEAGQIVLRRFGSPIWLFHDDLAVARAFAEGGDVTEDALTQFVLGQDEQAPTPPFVLLDYEDKEIRFDDGTPRLLYGGLSPVTPPGAPIVDDLDALRAEFPDVEFIWHRPYISDEQSAELWKLYQDAALVDLNPGVYDVSLDTYMQTSREAAGDYLERKMTEIEHLLEAGWRLALDPGDRLATFWCLLQAPYVLILDGSGVVALPYTDYANGSWEVCARPGAQDALRQILLAITGE